MQPFPRLAPSHPAIGYFIYDLFQVRAFGDSALQTLLKSGASSAGPPPTHRDVEGETSEVLSTLLTLLPTNLAAASRTTPNGPPTPKHALLTKSLEFGASLAADLVHARNFNDKAAWNRCIGVYLTIWSNAEVGSNFAEAVRSHYYAIDQVSQRSFSYNLEPSDSIFRPNMPSLLAILQKKARFCVILFFLWHMEPSFSFHIRHSVLSVAVDMVYLGQTDPGNQHLCVNYVTEK